MDDALAEALDRINRRFYGAAAREFDATRQAPWPGFEVVYNHLEERVPRALSLLDLGCGNGRFARYLMARRELTRVVGIDTSRELLARARSSASASEEQLWIEADVCRAWPLRAGLRFSCVSLLGVLHHVPSHERRRVLLERALERVLPGGLLVATFWQIAGEESIASRILPAQAVADLLRDESGKHDDPPQLEPRDRLITFGVGRVPRYVHECDAEERARLLAGLHARPVAEFESDGRNGRGNVYVLLTPEA